jgi:hypothetical protein
MLRDKIYTLQEAINAATEAAANKAKTPIILLGESFPKRGITAPCTIVLRDMGEDSHHRYVTHWRNDTDQGHTGGHYFEDLDKAVADFNERVQRERKNHRD